jgi:tellurite resistance protein TerC
MAVATIAQAKRIIKVVVGCTLLVVGTALLVLPGPGILVIAFGLALLSAEFVWARRLLDRLKGTVHSVRRWTRNRPS